MRNGIRNDMQTDNDPPYLEQRRSQVWDMHRTALYAPVRLDADTGGAPKMFNAATDNYPPVPSDGKPVFPGIPLLTASGPPRSDLLLVVENRGRAPQASRVTRGLSGPGEYFRGR